MDNRVYDWDRMLLDTDWLNLDWRQEMHNFQRVPWAEIRNGTLRQVAKLHAQYDETHEPSNSWPIRSPAADELIRRRELEEGNLGTETQAVPDWLPNEVEMFSPTGTQAPDHPDLPDLPPIFSQPAAPGPSTGGNTGNLGGASTPANQPNKDKKIPGLIYKDDLPGYWTVGFELELPVAVYRRGGLMAERPHPRDRRWEAEEIVTDDVPKDRVNKITVDRFIEVLNSQTNMVFIHREEDEDSPFGDLWAENMHRLEHGFPLVADVTKLDSTSRHSGERRLISRVAERAAVQARDFLKLSYFNNSEPARNFLLASREELEDAAQRAIMHGVPSTSDRYDAEKHLEELLHLEAYQARRDKRHVPLADMRPRYRAFSVYAMDEVNLDYAKGKQYRNWPQTEKTPSDLYGWVTIKISSPVLPFNWPPLDIDTMIQDICKVVRNNFRVHLDAPSIPATTQISVSHSSGLTLLDIQKLSSFLATEAVSNELRSLNRWYRSQRPHDKVCGPIREVSQLAKLAQTNKDVDNFDNSGIVPIHGPLRTEKLNQRAAEHLPIDLIKQRENLATRIFHTMIWQYTDINSIVNAVSTGHRSRKTEVMIKCQGTGDVVGKANPSPKDQSEQKSIDYDHKFFNVDKQRGVFEFRHMGGSLEPSHIMAWMTVCCRICDFVRNSPPLHYRYALEQIMRDGVPVIEALNIPAEARQFFQNRAGQSGYLKSKFNNNDNMIDWRDPFYPTYPTHP
ncbi:hypothetical protein F4813DRAFT_370014 [Daldinia decipiens]|uniref:uncharacterized protein n=1 Tax=Daldinia decipiens TaxID=326647 RepID=UPI0020C506A9|nr:uncharacterized protein F4813DRAFT_370014 [Daldinia decipiens]KAI1654709.1 hypothetical protein F4813DRAFT_370014 [Daldinia decipiens]